MARGVETAKILGREATRKRELPRCREIMRDLTNML
jgi:hypothetical protein